MYTEKGFMGPKAFWLKSASLIVGIFAVAFLLAGLVGCASEGGKKTTDEKQSEEEKQTEETQTPGFTVTHTITAALPEKDGSASVAIVLNSQPTGDVVLKATSSDTTELGLNLGACGDAPGNLETNDLTFTQDNWDTVQQIAVCATNDDLQDADQIVSVNLAVDTTTTVDPGYAAITLENIPVTIADDDTAGIKVDATAVAPINENGGSTTFTVVLQSQPTDPVHLTVTSPDTTELLINTATCGTSDNTTVSLSFSVANWNTPQTVSLCAVNDTVADLNIDLIAAVTVNGATTLDTLYAALNPNDVAITVVDDETASIVINTAGMTTISENGGVTSFVVSLSAEPVGSVQVDTGNGGSTVLALSVNNCTATAGSVALTLDATNWSTGLTVSACGVNNSVYGGGESVPVTAAVNGASTTSAAYLGQSSQTAVKVTDDDIYYVTPTGAGTGNGSSWANAFAGSGGLNTALTNAAGKGIWAGQGIYIASASAASVLTMTANAIVVGGFTGMEEIAADRLDPDLSGSILLGDFNGDDPTVTDNPASVVVTNSNVILDGFAIVGGTLRGVHVPNNMPGGNLGNLLIFGPATSGISIDGNSPTTIKNVTISGFTGGMYTGGGIQTLSPATIENLLVFGNNARDGAGIYLDNLAVDVYNSVFIDNNGTSSGLDLRGSANSVVLSNLSFIDNNSSCNGGGIHVQGAAVTASDIHFAGNAKAISAGCGQRGGSVNVYSGTLSLTNATVTDSSSDRPAVMVWTSGTATLTNVSIYNNPHTGLLANTATTANNIVFFGNTTNSGGTALTMNANCIEATSGGADSPFDILDASAEAFLKQTNNLCLDSGTNTDADSAMGANIWQSMTTAPDFAMDTGTVDMGRHYDPLHPVVQTFADNAGSLQWTTSQATSCRLLEKTAGNYTLQAAPANNATGTGFASTAATTYYLICQGQPALNGKGQHTIAKLVTP